MRERYVVIGDTLWDMDTEEPVEQLSDMDALDETYLNEFLAQAMLELKDDEDA